VDRGDQLVEARVTFDEPHHAHLRQRDHGRLVARRDQGHGRDPSLFDDAPHRLRGG
jgi:hypothetical protein